eukprot:15439204-Alexandrium_andersonii.AAC.1
MGTADGGADGAPAADHADTSPIPADGGGDGDAGDVPPRTFARVWETSWGKAAPYDNFPPPLVPDRDGNFVPRDIELWELRGAMFRIWNCIDATSRPLGDHIGTDHERH